jgi:Sulfotransferase domain
MPLSVNNHSSTGNLPNLVIIGAMKCGTTSLHYYLSLHPEIIMSREKELDFFVREGNRDRGVEWYRSNFVGDASIYGEASPKYTSYPHCNGVPERICSVLPDAKLIYIIRDPIERMLSEYTHRSACGSETRPLAEALTDHNGSYFYRSRYFMQLEQYLKFYPPSRILIITQGDLLNRRSDTLREVFRFLGVDDSFQSLRFTIAKHKSRNKRQLSLLGEALMRMPGMGPLKNRAPSLYGYLSWCICYPFSRSMEQPVLNPQLRRELAEYLKDDIQRLRSYTGRDFTEWSL